MKLEVIAKNCWDVLKINRSQADRIELCRNLGVGGLTPNKLTIWLATKVSKKPINVMLRPSGYSFNYTDQEFEKMLNMAKFISKTKANGVVFGAMNDKNEIDEARMNQILALIPNQQKTFHKAFDELNDLNQGLMLLNQLKVDHVLTAGGKTAIADNSAILKQLKDTPGATIIAGGGINWENVTAICKVADEVHVGKLARKKNSWNSAISVKNINKLVAILAQTSEPTPAEMN